MTIVSTIQILTVITLIIGIPATIIATRKVLKEISKKNPLVNIPKKKGLCIGREKEISEIQKNILNKTSIFIYGTSGIGKTTLVAHAIKKTDLSKLKNIFSGGVLHYDYATNPSHESACNKLSEQIKNQDYKDIGALLNSEKHLIWLDSCEEAQDLYKIISLSDNSVFILNSRDKKQFEILNSFEYNSECIELSVLNPKDSFILINKITKKDSTFLKKHKNVLMEIVDNLGFHPYLISNACEEELFKNNPDKYLKLLKEVGLSVIKIDHNSRVHKDGIDLEAMVIKSVQITIDSKLSNMSYDAKRFFGLMGCIADEGLPLILMFMELKNEKRIKKEILNTNLIYETDRLIFKFKHTSVYRYFSNNFDKLSVDKDFLLSFIDFVVMFSYAADQRNSQFRNKKFYYKNHLNKVLLFTIPLLDFHETSTLNKITRALNLLSEFGFYQDVLNLIAMIENQLNLITDDFQNDINRKLSGSRILTYDGLGWEEDTINLLEHLFIYYSNHQSENFVEYITSVDNLLIYCLKYGKYSKAKELFNETTNILENLNKINVEKEGEDLVILNYISLHYELMYLNNEDINDEDIKKIIDLLHLFQLKIGEKEMDTVDVMLILAFILIKKGRTDDGFNLIVKSIFIINTSYSFKDPLSIDRLEKIVDFFIELGNYEQASALNKTSLDIAYLNFGNEHVITNKVRRKSMFIDDYFKSVEFKSENIIISLDYKKDYKKRKKIIEFIKKYSLSSIK